MKKGTNFHPIDLFHLLWTEMNSLLKEYWHFMTRTYQNAVCVLYMMNTVMFIS